MPLVLVDILPAKQAIVNTAHIVQAREVDGRITIYLVGGHEIQVPHESAARLYDELGDCIPIL